MKNLNISAFAFAAGLAVSVGAMADSMSKEQHKFLEQNLETEYRIAKTGCNSLAGNAYDLCVLEVKGNKSISRAELEASYKPSVKTRYDAQAASADADYSVAVARCNDLVANDKGRCMNEATSAKTHEMAEAMVQIRTSKPEPWVNERLSN